MKKARRLLPVLQHHAPTRHFSTNSQVAIYREHGPVEQVIKIEPVVLPDPQRGQVLVKMLAAPINPADLNMIEGVYSITPKLPAVGGNEGVGIVEQVGSGVTTLKVGDRVIPAKPGFGTWRTHAVVEADTVDVVGDDIPAAYSATISVNPCTAYRMLHDFVKLKPGDVVIQNGANSSVGQCVIQLACVMGIHTVNIMRNRPGFEERVEKLTALGRSDKTQCVMVTEEFADGKNMDSFLESKKLHAPVLGLNCVGGKSSTQIARLLKDGAPMVTYGGMSRKPVQVPTGRLIFNDIRLHGFWLSHWVHHHSTDERMAMIKAITEMIHDKKLQWSMDQRPFNDFAASLKRAQEGFRDEKIVLVF